MTPRSTLGRADRRLLPHMGEVGVGYGADGAGYRRGMSQKDHRDLDAPTPPGGPLRRDAPAEPEPGHREDHRHGPDESTEEAARKHDDE